MHKNKKNSRLSPLLKWPGGKERELANIHDAMPGSFTNYYEPFVGGGAVYFSIEAEKYFINDKYSDLISLYNAVSSQDSNVFEAISGMMRGWVQLKDLVEAKTEHFVWIYNRLLENQLDDDKCYSWAVSFESLHREQLSSMVPVDFSRDLRHLPREIHKNLDRKLRRMADISKKSGRLIEEDVVKNIEAALKSAFYTHYRHLFRRMYIYSMKPHLRTALFYFIRNYAYGGMFRYNKKGEFNVPYGGITYNGKDLREKLKYFQSEELISHLSRTVVDSMDFEDFFAKRKPTKNDFMFLDPPYDSEFSTYAENEFNKADQARLASYLINKCEAKWMLVIKHTDYIFGLYHDKGLHISSFDKRYAVSIRNRNNRDVEHLIITNY